MLYSGLPGKLAEVRDRIAHHQAKGGWTRPVQIVAVTKGHEIDAIQSALAAGLCDIGENRVQEALEKQEKVAARGAVMRWHLIGTLQRNKVRHVIDRFELIHSVDRPELVAELERRLPLGQRQRVLIEVNCSAEPQKGGVPPEGLEPLVEQVSGCAQLELVGLMTMAPLTGDERVQRAAFSRLRQLREQLERTGHALPELSMGMSGDYPVAVEEGATIVRLGTVLFGERMQ